MEVLELVKFLEILLVNYVLEFLLSERHIFLQHEILILVLRSIELFTINFIHLCKLF